MPAVLPKRLARVTIDGLEVPFGGEFGSPSWSFTSGVSAPEIVWRLDPAAADQVLSKKEVEIVFDYENAPTLTIKRVVVIREVPTGSFFTRGVLLSDVRWYWTRKWLKRSFNARMRTGSKRLVNAPAGTPTQVTPFTDDIVFAKFSLKQDAKNVNGKPWTADEMIQAILGALTGKNGSQTSTRDRSSLKPNDVEVDDRGDHALARVLAAAGGGIDVRVAPDATVILFDRVMGDEKEMIEKFVPYGLLNLGFLRYIRMNHVVPPGVTVWFSREMELRLDYIEETDGTSGQAVDDVPLLDNVCQVADFTIKVSGNTEVLSTWVMLASYMSAINATPGNAPFPSPDAGGKFSPPQKLTTTVLQDRFMGPYLFLQYVTGFGVAPSFLWSARIGSLVGSYRRDFRINRRFLGRILPGSIRAVRTGIADAATGLRQPSPVWQDYCQKPTFRFLAWNKDAALGWNTHILPPLSAGQDLGSAGSKAYPNSASNPYAIRIDQCTNGAAPARLHVLDPFAGVLRVEMVRDFNDQIQELVPSLLNKIPTTNPFKVATLGAFATWDQCSLARNHRMITIVSCVPAGPNNEGQLQGYSAPFTSAIKKLGITQTTTKAGGPGLEIRCNPSLERARYAWSDDGAQTIIGAFIDTKNFPSSLTPLNQDILTDITQAFAAAIYATMLDHYEGSQAVEFSPTIVPKGSVHTVVHGVDFTGRALTTINAEPQGVPIRPEALMSAATRRVLFREIGI